MKTNILIFATAYPYTAGILAIFWIGSAILLYIDPSLSFNMIIGTNVVVTLILSAVGFRK